MLCRVFERDGGFVIAVFGGDVVGSDVVDGLEAFGRDVEGVKIDVRNRARLGRVLAGNDVRCIGRILSMGIGSGIDTGIGIICRRFDEIGVRGQYFDQRVGADFDRWCGRGRYRRRCGGLLQPLENRRDGGRRCIR